MPTPIPFADDGGTPAWRVRHTLPTPGIPIWRFLLAVAALPPLLAFTAAASWLAWMCFQGVMGPPGAVIALRHAYAIAIQSAKPSNKLREALLGMRAGTHR